MDNFDLRKFLAEGKLFEDVSDYADRIMGAGVDDPIGLIDFYDDNIEDLPEPMDPKIFRANIDAIKAKVSKYQKMMDEGTLNEVMSPQDVVDIADTVAEEFTKESADAGEFLVYSVGRMEADDMSFELDTDLTSQSPKGIDMRGVGEGWGGIFRIKPTEDGYEVRNAEKGGLVAMIDTMGNFKMLSAAESRDELYGEPDVDWKNDEPDFNRYMEEGKEEKENKPSNKMKKSELKEMIKTAMLEDARTDAEQEGYKDGFEDAKDDIEAELKKMKVSEAEGDMIPAEKLFALISRDLKFSPLVQDGVMLSKEDAIEIMRHVIAIEGSDISAEAALGEYIASGDLNEAENVEKDVDVDVEDDENVDVDIEKDVEVDDEETEADIDVKASVSGESEDVEAVQGLLTKALEMSQALGDEKLEDQIGNTITYFTRAHVSRVNELDINVDDAANTEMEAALGLEEAKDEEVKENLNESVVFPMWNKIK